MYIYSFEVVDEAGDRVKVTVEGNKYVNACEFLRDGDIVAVKGLIDRKNRCDIKGNFVINVNMDVEHASIIAETKRGRTRYVCLYMYTYKYIYMCMHVCMYVQLILNTLRLSLFSVISLPFTNGTVGAMRFIFFCMIRL